MKPSEMLTISFWSGFVAHMCFVGFYQDWIGKEKYLHMIKNEWMNTHWIMWLLIGLASLAVYKYVKSRVQ